MSDSTTKSEPVMCRGCFEDITPSLENPTMVCPKCGTENIHGPPPIPSSSATATTPAPESLGNPNLRTCVDCGKEVSIHAESCPHCGAAFAKRKTHGVFFYVFWGVISLMATGLILVVGLAMVSGFIAGLHQVPKVSNVTVATEGYAQRINTFADRWDMPVEKVMRWEFALSQQGLLLIDYGQALENLSKARDKALGYHKEDPKLYSGTRRLKPGDPIPSFDSELSQNEKNVAATLRILKSNNDL